MFNAIKNATFKSADEYGLAAAILIFLILCAITFAVLCGFMAIAMALWNGVLVALFPVIPQIGYWQMWGLYLLFDILLKPSISSSTSND
jgi:hypothetical protein